jgi:hypothetical protein
MDKNVWLIRRRLWARFVLDIAPPHSSAGFSIRFGFFYFFLNFDSCSLQARSLIPAFHVPGITYSFGDTTS